MQVTINWGEPKRVPPRAEQQLRCLSYNDDSIRHQLSINPAITNQATATCTIRILGFVIDIIRLGLDYDLREGTGQATGYNRAWTSPLDLVKVPSILHDPPLPQALTSRCFSTKIKQITDARSLP